MDAELSRPQDEQMKGRTDGGNSIAPLFLRKGMGTIGKDIPSRHVMFPHVRTHECWECDMP